MAEALQGYWWYRNSAKDKKKAFNLGCIGQQAATLEDFEGHVENATVRKVRLHSEHANQILVVDLKSYRRTFWRLIISLEVPGKKLSKDTNWTGKMYVKWIFYEVSEDANYFTCDLADILAYYISGEWSIDASITNSSEHKVRRKTLRPWHY